MKDERKCQGDLPHDCHPNLYLVSIEDELGEPTGEQRWYCENCLVVLPPEIEN